MKHNYKTYGTNRSKLLKEIIARGFKPIAITVMVCEETFVFETEEEANKACEVIQNEFGNEGWWYGLNGKYPFKETYKKYCENIKEYDPDYVPKIYWLDESKNF